MYLARLAGKGQGNGGRTVSSGRGARATVAVMSYQNLLVEAAGPVADVTVNRPEGARCLDDTTLRELTDAFSPGGAPRSAA